MTEKICSNTSPLWHLGRVKEKFPNVKSLDLIKEVYSEVCVAKAVVEELGIKYDENGVVYFKGEIVPQATRDYVLNETEILEVQDSDHVEKLLKKYTFKEEDKEKNRGECETLVLAIEQRIEKCLLANDGAEKMFEQEGRDFMNIIKFADFCFQNGIITEAEAHDYLQALSDIGYYQKTHSETYTKFGAKQ